MARNGAQFVPEWSKSKQAVYQLAVLSVVALMTSFLALALFASAHPGSGTAASEQAPTKAVASARATVRILSGAKVSLGKQAEAQGYKLNNAKVTVEDGRQLPAKLVEFQ